MKKIGWIILCVLLVLSAGSAYAQGENEALRIDNEAVYAGMDKAYSGGYVPGVQNGTASVVLPLLPVREVKNAEINVRVDLGDPLSAPFVFGNYDKTVKLADNKTTDGKTVKNFLVAFSLPLAGNRQNGRYPITITAQGQDKDGAPFSQAFTLYVTVTDGSDPNAVPTTDIPQDVPQDMPQGQGDPGGGAGGGGGGEGAKPQPKLIVSNYTVDPSPVQAGQPFKLKITLQNTSDSQAITNLKVSLAGEGDDVIPMDGTNSFYFKKVAKKESVTIDTQMLVQGAALPKPQKITLTIGYEGANATAYTDTATVVVQVQQLARLECDEPNIPKEVNAGDTLSLSLNVMNMGKGTLYNVRAALDAPGLVPEGSIFIGNMESGTSKKGDMYVFIGTLEGEGKYGYTSGKLTLSYEDEFGTVSEQVMDVATDIKPPVINAPVEEEEEKPETQSQWWISVIIVGGVLVAVLVARYFVKRAKRRSEDEDS